MSTKWKTLAEELYDTSCPGSGKVNLENSAIFHVQEVEKFNWIDVRYLMSTKSKSITGGFYDISRPRSGKV